MLKADVHKFLDHLKMSIEQRLPPPDVLRSEIRELVKSSVGNPRAKHMGKPEEAFLNTFVIPTLFNELQSEIPLDPIQARQALLSENYRHMRDKCSNTPARSDRHPFDKTFAPKPAAVMNQWTGKSGKPLIQSCPDFALRYPCPFSMVFEGKYFERGGKGKAETDLVTNIYQAFFYRALPKIDETKTRPAWDYDYACLLACDASPDGALKRAWEEVRDDAKRGFWGGANLYVMVLRNDT